MSDSNLQSFHCYGTNAQRLAFTMSAPPTTGVGGGILYVWFETDTGNTYAGHGGSWTQVNTSSGSGSSTIVKPQGRLTLTSGTPVLAADTTAQGTVYYTPYEGNLVPIYSGSAFAMSAFTERSLTLNITDNVSGSLYDVFIYNNAGTLTLGTGPAWSSTTSRGTGAGTTELQMLNGIWTNKNAITLRAGGVSLGSQAANTCTYLGSIYCTANGQTGMSFRPAAAAGGTANVLGVFNAFNRVAYSAYARDNTTSWSAASAGVWQALNAGATGSGLNNRISYIDGLAQASVRAALQTLMQAGSGNATAIGMSRDSASATPNVTTEQIGNSTIYIGAATSDTFAPALGFHYIQAQQFQSGGTGILAGANATQQFTSLQVDLQM